MNISKLEKDIIYDIEKYKMLRIDSQKDIQRLFTKYCRRLLRKMKI